MFTPIDQTTMLPGQHSQRDKPMPVLHLVKSLAYLGMAASYWTMLHGVEQPWIHAVLCCCYLLLFVTEAAELVG